MARAAVTIPSTFARDWLALPATDGNVPVVACWWARDELQ